MKLWIGNLDPAATDEDIRVFVGKYAPGLEIKAIERVPGDGTRPAAMLTLEGSLAALYEAQQRLSGLIWNQRALVVQVMRR